MLFRSLCYPIDGSPPGSPVPGILQMRTLEWVAISFSRGSSQPRDQTWSPALQTDALPSEPPGKPIYALGAQKQGAATKGLTDGEATRSASPPHPRSRRPLRFTSQAGTAWSQRHHTPARHTDHTRFPGMAATQLASLALMVPLQGSSGSLEGRRSWIVQATLGDSYSPSLGGPAHW